MAYMFIMHMLQEHGKQAAEEAAGAAQHAAETAGHAAAAHSAEAAAHHGEHVPFIVEKVNDWLGPVVFEIQKQIMPPIYHALKIFGPQWPGEGKTFDQYYHLEHQLPIPTQVVMFLIVVL